MKDYGIKESWSKELVIESGIGKSGNWGSYEPIMMLKSGEILMLFNKDVLMLYNPKLGSFKKLNIYGIKLEFYGIAHIPSFVSLKDVAKGESLMVSKEDCLEKLKMLPEVTQGDPLYLFGMELIKNPFKREVFVELPNDEFQVAWIKMEKIMTYG
ncbi:F-box protein [Camellia lanceoleosa]|uniref:F-box protein n=1 Tax=Camellia lanceoleosa TaxID=1840588 RepID=A0ACC0HCR1_9ERIC|nr:F-box protein [Camellia lanceoleosa]